MAIVNNDLTARAVLVPFCSNRRSRDRGHVQRVPTRCKGWRGGRAVLTVVPLCLSLYSAVCLAQSPDMDGVEQQEDHVSIKLIDAQSYRPNVQAGIDLDPMQGAQNSMLRSGAVADGTSVLVVQIKLSKKISNAAVNVAIKHTNTNSAFPQTADYIGSLWNYNANKGFGFPSIPAPDNSADSTSLGIPGNGKDMRVCYYRPPNNFWFGKHVDRQDISVRVNVSGKKMAGATISLRRDALLLCHGVASSAASLGKWQEYLRKSGNIDVVLIDYANSNTSGYDTNAAIVPQQIANQVNKFRSAGIASTRIDYAAHSMGGCLIKWYTLNLGKKITTRRNGFPSIQWAGNKTKFQYKRADDFGIGDVHRVVTVGTPFYGSPLADLISGLGKNAVQTIISQSKGKLTGDGCAAGDLGASSSATSILTSALAAVAWHPIIGYANPTKTESNLTGGFDFLLRQAEISPSDCGLYPSNSDCVVFDFGQADRPQYSVGGGIQSSVVHGTVHTDETLSSAVWKVSAKAFDLLFDSPAAAGYTAAYNMFNQGM